MNESVVGYCSNLSVMVVEFTQSWINTTRMCVQAMLYLVTLGVTRYILGNLSRYASLSWPVTDKLDLRVHYSRCFRFRNVV